MTAKTTGNWLVDLNNLTCRNTENQIIIAFEKRGPALVGKIKYMPIGLSAEWIVDPNGERYIRNAVIEADEVFFRAYFNREVDRKTERLLA